MYGFVLGVFFLITLTSVLKWGVSTEGFCPRGGFRPGGFVLGGVLSYTLTSVFKLGGFDRGWFRPGGFVLHSSNVQGCQRRLLIQKLHTSFCSWSVDCKAVSQ